jgi:hypothetical protein
MKKNYIFLITLLAILSACTDLKEPIIDKVPKDQYTPDPIVDMGVIYAPMREFLDWGGYWFAQELTSDEMVCPTRAGDWDDGGKWRVLHQHIWDNKTEAVAAMWGRFYDGIVQANKFIETYSFAKDKPIVAQAIAKAKILRAYYYYLLIDNYKDVPYVTSFLNAEQQPSKLDRAAIFDSIVNEVESSYPLLPYSTSKTAVTKGMAFSLLAKLYLNAQVYTGTPQWQKSEIYCDSVIALNQYSLEMSSPLTPFVTENQNSPENIWLIPYDEDNYQGFNLHMRTLHYNSNLTFDMTAGPWNGFAVMEDFYNTYEDNDKRKAGFLVGQQKSSTGADLTDPGAEGAPLVFDPHIPALLMDASFTPVEIRLSGVRVAKFEIKMGAKANLSNDFPIFRYADILLMKAESMIRQGKNGDEYVNMIRSRAGLSDWSGVTLSQLLEERGREMFWEAHRRQDLIRFNEFNKEWWEKPASTSDRNTFPIPQWAVDANPNLAK